MQLPVIADYPGDVNKTRPHSTTGLHNSLGDMFEKKILGESKALAESISLSDLRRAGIDVDPFSYDFVYGYPPLGSLGPVDHPESFMRWAPPSRLGLYLHLPFCSYSCSFCYFAKKINQSQTAVEDYLQILSKEIRHASGHLGGTIVDSVYFGGGTPTYLTTTQLLSLIRLVQESFCIADEYEWTVEASPETIDEDKAALLVRAGVSRLSIGVQSFSDSLLRTVSRKHSVAQALLALKSIASSGVPSFNVDLIYGFPSQTIADLWNDIAVVRDIAAPSVTWYQLWRHMDTPLGRREGDEKKEVTAEDIHQLKCVIHTAMTSLGYLRDKVDWFVSSPSHAQRQQEHKWRNGDFLGMGVSAYGYIAGRYYRNHPTITAYSDSVSRWGWGIGQGRKLSDEERFRRGLVLGIKSGKGVPANVLELATRGVRHDLDGRIDRLVEAGLIAAHGGRLHLTEAGQLYGDCVARALAFRESDEHARRAFKSYTRDVGG